MSDENKNNDDDERIGAAPMRPLDFLHFRSNQSRQSSGGVEMEYSSDAVDWNETKHKIEWHHNDNDEALPFDEALAVSQAVEIKLDNYGKNSPYDTRSVMAHHYPPPHHSNMRESEVVESAVPKKQVVLDRSSTPQTVASSVFFPDQDEEDVSSNKLPSPMLSQKTRRRNIFISLAVGLVCLILLVVGLRLTVGGNSRGGDGGDPSNVGSDGGDNVPTISSPPPVATPNPTFLPTTATPRPPTATSSPTATTTSPGDDDTEDPKVTYRPGVLTVQENGLILSKGLKSRKLAQTGQVVKFSNGQTSTIPFHILPDGAATFSIPPEKENAGGWVYVSNSEGKEKGTGGVAAVTFDKHGNVIDYRNLLNGTTMNCSGGKTPWDTWVSCEEYAPGGKSLGQIYQIHPFDERKPEITAISSTQGGRYEAFAYDDRDRDRPVFYASEDQRNGPTRRWRPDPANVDWNKDPWNMLHGPGTLDYLVLTPNVTNDKRSGTYDWVDSIHQARPNAFEYYPSTEGIDRHDNFLYMACKREKMLYIIDLDSNKYVRYSLEGALFDGEPDSVTRILEDTQDIMYFNEDLGEVSGIHARNTKGQMFTILEGPGWSNEVTGVAFSPSAHHMYFCFQEDGVMFEVTREDGLPFTAKTLNVRYHNNPVESLWTRRLR